MSKEKSADIRARSGLIVKVFDKPDQNIPIFEVVEAQKKLKTGCTGIEASEEGWECV